jgi:hypothetical protein
MSAFLVLLLLPVTLFGVRIARDSGAVAEDVTRDWHRFHPFGATPEALVLRADRRTLDRLQRNKG